MKRLILRNRRRCRRRGRSQERLPAVPGRPHLPVQRQAHGGAGGLQGSHADRGGVAVPNEGIQEDHAVQDVRQEGGRGGHGQVNEWRKQDTFFHKLSAQFSQCHIRAPFNYARLASLRVLLKRNGEEVMFSKLRTGFVRSAIQFDLDSLVSDKSGTDYMMVRTKPYTCENTYGMRAGGHFFSFSIARHKHGNKYCINKPS